MTSAAEPFADLTADFLRAQHLRGRHILITGAAADIGRQVALACARQGANLWLLDDKQDALAPLHDEICADELPAPTIVEFDLHGAREHFAFIADAIDQAAPALDGLVHCAGVGAALTPMAQNDLHAWSRVHEAVVVAPLLLTQQLLPCLARAESASVVFSVLDVGRRPRANWGALGANFAALENAVQTFADEFASRNIRFNTLDPGKVKTALRKKFYPGEAGGDLRAPDDALLLAHYVYLLADAGRDCNGRQLSVPPFDSSSV